MASGKHDAQDGDEARPKRRRLPGVNLRSGSVKQARLEVGMSLAQLGKGHVTAPAIYLIETGRTRPSLPTLEHIARRTGKPIEFFLAEPASAEDQTAASLLSMAAMLAEGRNEKAIELGRWLLDQGASAFRVGRIRFMLAQAYLNAGRHEEAEVLLAESRAHFEAINDGVMLAETIGAQAVLAGRLTSNEAVQLAEKALEIATRLTPRPVPLEARLYGILAAAHMAGRDWDAAIDAYSKAIEAGSRLLDVKSAADLYSALGAAYQHAGEMEPAARYVMVSVGLREVLRDRATVARAQQEMGQAMISRGDAAGARKHLVFALELSRDPNLDLGQAPALLGLCEVSLLEGDVDGAAELGRQALAEAEGMGQAAAAAEARVLLGRIADHRGQHEVADREFEHAIRGFEGLGLSDRLLQTHGVYADVLERRGEIAKAYFHMKQALQASRPGRSGRSRDDPASETASSA